MANMIHWLRVVLGGVLLFSTAASADRYFTWVDEQGQVRSTVVEEENPLTDRAEKTIKEQRSQPLDIRAGQPRSGSRDEAGSAPDTSDSVEYAPPGPDRRVSPLTPGPLRESTAGRVDQDPVFNLSNFPDAAELEARGYLREDDAGPFFTWTDAAGVLHNTPFNPGKEINIARQAEQAQTERLFRGGAGDFSQALTLRRDAGLPSGAALHAAAVLGLKGDEPALIEEFAQRCCEAIDKASFRRLDPDRGASLRIGTDAPVFDFATGRSPYLIVELPSRRGIFPIRLRTFVEDGVFLPTLVFLDEHWRPVRMMTDIAFTYEPESWYRLGYLQARVPVEPQKGERWLLVLSKGSDLSSPSVFEVAKSETTQALRPSSSGELELTLGINPNPMN